MDRDQRRRELDTLEDHPGGQQRVEEGKVGLGHGLGCLLARGLCLLTALLWGGEWGAPEPAGELFGLRLQPSLLSEELLYLGRHTGTGSLESAQSIEDNREIAAPITGQLLAQ